MKFLTLILASVLFSGAAFAGHDRVITVVGNGVGGTTHGDKRAACDRAEDDAASECSSRRGYLEYVRERSCNCQKKPGSRDDYTCRASVYGDCYIRGR
ncbi:hypothetical protein GW915_10535 [bacterium]|nr:hypothetical protein [bacterium]